MYRKANDSISITEVSEWFRFPSEQPQLDFSHVTRYHQSLDMGSSLIDLRAGSRLKNNNLHYIKRMLLAGWPSLAFIIGF